MDERSAAEARQRHALQEYARAIAQDGSPRQNAWRDLQPLFDAQRYDEATSQLAEGVERHSDGEYTIRAADPKLFKSRSQGATLYLVRCPKETPAGTVTNLTEGMTPVTLGPQSNAFRMGMQLAAAQE